MPILLIPACCLLCVLFKMICVKCLYATFLRRYIQTRKGHSKIAPSKLEHVYFKGALSYKPQNFVLWLAKILNCDMTEPYLQCGEVLMRYETLYFQPHINPRNICDVNSSNHHNSTMLHVKNIFNTSYYSLAFRQATGPKFWVCSSRRLGIIRVAIWEVLFFE